MCKMKCVCTWRGGFGACHVHWGSYLHMTTTNVVELIAKGVIEVCTARSNAESVDFVLCGLDGHNIYAK